MMRKLFSILIVFALVLTVFLQSVYAAPLATPSFKSPLANNKTVTIKNTSDLTISWGAVKGATYYSLAILNENTNQKTECTIKKGTSYKFSKDNLISGNKYKCAVGAYNDKGEASNWASAGFKVTGVPAPFQTPALTGDLATDIKAIALSQNGYKPNSYGSVYGNKYGNPKGAWCSYFIKWCAEIAGVKNNLANGFAVNWLQYGVSHNSDKNYVPQVGDLVVYGSKHVGIVTGHLDKKDKFGYIIATTIDGNLSGVVMQSQTNWFKANGANYAPTYVTPKYLNK